jgi:peptidoglycan/xylan/chitin deacetylase (PgdA/CDA1 family)
MAKDSMIQATLKRSAKSALLGAMKSVGAFSRAARSEQRRAQLLILCYHGLSLADEHEWLPKLFITPEGFRERLQTLRGMGANVLPLGEAIEHLHKGTLPPASVVITFDDGFYDFLKFGVPLLNEFGMPATLYLTTHYCDYRLPIVNLALDYVLWKSKKDFVTLPEHGMPEPMPIRNYQERQIVVWKLLAWAEKQGLKTVEKDQLARKIAGLMNVAYESLLDRRMLQIMSPEEAKKTFECGVDLQLHTHRHRTPRDKILFQREVRDNSEFIQNLTGKTPVHFCYPSGDYCPDFLPWLSEMGVTSATTCEAGMATAQSQDLLLPRFLDDSSVDLLRFQSFVAGVFT